MTATCIACSFVACTHLPNTCIKATLLIVGVFHSCSVVIRDNEVWHIFPFNVLKICNLVRIWISAILIFIATFLASLHSFLKRADQLIVLACIDEPCPYFDFYRCCISSINWHIHRILYEFSHDEAIWLWTEMIKSRVFSAARRHISRHFYKIPLAIIIFTHSFVSLLIIIQNTSKHIQTLKVHHGCLAYLEWIIL